jgi:hypothetical protein
MTIYTPTPQTNVGDYKGRTGLSPSAAYPSTVEREMYSFVPPYPSTMLAYVETTQVPQDPDPTDQQVQDLGTPEGMMNRHFNLALILLI